MENQGGSIAEIAKLNAEQTRVETQIAVAARLIQRLQVDLPSLTVTKEGQPPAEKDTEVSPDEGSSPEASAD